MGWPKVISFKQVCSMMNLHLGRRGFQKIHPLLKSNQSIERLKKVQISFKIWITITVYIWR